MATNFKAYKESVFLNLFNNKYVLLKIQHFKYEYQTSVNNVRGDERWVRIIDRESTSFEPLFLQSGYSNRQEPVEIGIVEVKLLAATTLLFY